jgi:hypothetical protein
MEERRVLGDDTDRSSQTIQLHVFDPLAVDRYRPRRRLVEPIEQTEDGGFAGTGRADDGDFLAGGYGEGKVAEDGTIGMVTEGNVLEANRSAFQVKRGGLGGVLGRAKVRRTCESVKGNLALRGRYEAEGVEP